MTRHEVTAIDETTFTVAAIDDETGEANDLNDGEPCRNHTDVQEFIEELHSMGAFDRETADDLREQALSVAL